MQLYEIWVENSETMNNFKMWKQSTLRECLDGQLVVESLWDDTTSGH